MSDVKFQFYDVPNRYQDVIQRMAVLYPLRGVCANMDAVREKTSELLDQWRARIGSLTAEGWMPRVTDAVYRSHSIMYARNCKPTFAISGHRTRACTLAVICPFCYARWVRELWMLIDANFPAPDPTPVQPGDELEQQNQRVIMLDDSVVDQVRRPTNTYRYRMIERHHRFYRPVLPEDNPDGITVEQNLRDLLDNIEASRAGLIKEVDPVGAFLYTTIEPHQQGQQWKIHHRQIFKVLPGHELPERISAGTNGSIAYSDRPTRRDVLQAVANVCRYPRGLLTGEVERVVQLLNVRRNIQFRGCARFRSFRQTVTYE